MFFRKKSSVGDYRAHRQAVAERRFENTMARPKQPADEEIDPYGNVYKVYPEQSGILRWDQADADTMLFTPEFYAVQMLTNGWDDLYEGLREIGVVHFRGDTVIDDFWMYVDSTSRVAKQSERLATNEFARYLDETVPVVAFNASRGFSSLHAAYFSGQRCTSVKYIDIMSLSYDLWPSSYTRTLPELEAISGIKLSGYPHTALNDALSIGAIYLDARTRIWDKMAKNGALARKYEHPKKPTRLVEPEHYYLARRGTSLDKAKKEMLAINYYGRAIAADPSYLEESERYAILLRRNMGIEKELPVVQTALDCAKSRRDKYYIGVFTKRLAYIQKHLKKPL